jgi:tetraacyldisaccharide 4'-kinase
MIRIKKNIDKVITGDNKNGSTWFPPILSVASTVYGGAVKLRRTFYNRGIFKSKRLPCFIISIGNIVAGGTGKTPMTMYVSETVEQWGYKTVIISRGYKGKAERHGGVVSDGRSLLMTPEAAGDEPYMMAAKLKNVPVVAGKDRVKMGRLAIREFNPDVLVLDDGFQHLRLQRDLDIVLLDYRNPFGNGHLLPRGVLREPVSSLSGADAIILTKSEGVRDKKILPLIEKIRSFSGKATAYQAIYDPFVYKVIKGKKKKLGINMSGAEKYRSESIAGRTVFGFSGLADNHNFLRTLKSLKCKVLGYLEFPDHHSYSDSDLKNILVAAKKSMSESLITSEKDYVRIAHKIEWPIDLYVVGIEIEFGADVERFNGFIRDRLKKIREKY